jgi:hypothetical protein
MTTITIDRALLEQALVALSAPNHCVFSEPPICVDIRAALAAPATAPEKTVKEIMEFVRHYAANTFSSATLEDKIRRSLAAPATAPEPSWQDAPTCAGLWFCDEGDENPYRFTCHNVSIPLNPHLVGEGERWYGPIPEDKP